MTGAQLRPALPAEVVRKPRCAGPRPLAMRLARQSPRAAEALGEAETLSLRELLARLARPSSPEPFRPDWDGPAQVADPPTAARPGPREPVVAGTPDPGAAHFSLTAEVRLDALLALRERLNARPAGPGARITLNDLLVRASAMALRDHPRANASWTPEGVVAHAHADVGIAVAAGDGVAVPILRRADAKGLAAISREARDLAERARSGRIDPAELAGGAFTLANLGLHGVGGVGRGAGWF
jgi:hypothetical protein